jgi:23S rRNA (adenine2503-C2)-methyltransferase
MTHTAAKRDIRSFNSEEINNIIESLGEKKFRAKQIYDWIWTQGVTSFDAMTNLSVLLREKLKESYYFNTLTLDKSQLSDDGTYKVRYRLHDGHLIETVMIPVASDKR